jgi:hypothetical protein
MDEYVKIVPINHSIQMRDLRAWRSLHQVLSSENSVGIEPHANGTWRQRDVEKALNAMGNVD